MKIIIFVCILFIGSSMGKKKKTRSILRLDKTLNNMDAQKAMQTLSSYKELTGKSPKITLTTLNKLAHEGNQRALKKLFLKDQLDILTDPYLTNNELLSMPNLDFSQEGIQKEIWALLGIPAGIIIGKMKPAVFRKFQRYKMKYRVLKQANYIKKLTRNGSLTHINTFLDDLESRFEYVNSEVVNKAFTLKALAELRIKNLEKLGEDDEEKKEHEEVEEHEEKTGHEEKKQEDE
jgi:hypothetical protein